MKSSLSVLLLAGLNVAVATPMAMGLDKRQADDATYVTDITECPPVAPRSSPPKSVHDL